MQEAEGRELSSLMVEQDIESQRKMGGQTVQKY